MKKRIITTAAVAAALCLAALAAAVIALFTGLPDVSRLKHYRPPSAAEVFDRNGEPLTQYHERGLRFWVAASEIPKEVVWSVIIAEDDTFFEHQGINYKATWDALVLDVQKRRFARGGSTITQQMIKNVLLTKEKTILRKVREYILARRAEEILTKREILQLYLNEVEWGDGLYGIEAAGRFYFDKRASELSVGEAALLAGMLPNPRYYNPFKRPDKATLRRDQVLSNMLQAHVITEEEFNAALAAPLALRKEGTGRFDVSLDEKPEDRPCWQRVLENVLLDRYGEQGLYREGKKIRTTLDRALQEEISRREGSGSGVPDRVVVVRKGTDIHALACVADEGAVRSWVNPEWLPLAEYAVETVPVRDLFGSVVVEMDGTGTPAAGPRH